MSLPSLDRYFRDSRLFHRVVQEWDFCTYREVREFDFTQGAAVRASKRAAREARASGSRAKPLEVVAQS